ncbi:MAG TPA: hypothetical protein VMV46_22485 [Thermoanaerobaculia bacterium]|nr:hypothetical protein [Thermoanaerobaculia bacterium]
MIESLDLASSTLELRFEGAEELQAFLDKARDGTPIVRLAERLEEGSQIDLVLQSEGTRWTVPARVRQVFRSGADRFGTILDVLRWDAETSVAFESAPAATGEPETDVPEPTPAAGVAGETTGTSVQFEIKALNPAQRALLATKANRTQRQVLLRESSPQVQKALLNNPWIEPTEILELAKSTTTVAPVLQRIAGEHRYLQNGEIRVALVKHPNTPTPIALRLIEGLRTQDLRMLAKSQALRETVRGAALRAYLRRQ